MNRRKLIDTELNQPATGCHAHRSLVDLLVSMDGRLLRLEVMLLVACASALGALGKSVVLPFMVRMMGG